MDESRLFALLLVLALVAAIISLQGLGVAWSARENPLQPIPFLEDLKDVIVVEYNASFNGFILEESITYKIQGDGLSMVYRSFSTSLRYTPSGSPGEIVALEVTCPQGFYAYIYDADKVLHTNAPDDVASRLEDKLRKANAGNEAGCYNPGGIDRGVTVTATYRFLLVPEKVYDDGGSRLYYFKLASANEHAPYYNVTIEAVNDTLIAVIPPQGPGDPQEIARLGALPQGAGLELAVITGQEPPHGSETEHVESVNSILDGKVKKRRLLADMAWALLTLPTLMALASPLALTLIYHRTGREYPPREAIPYGDPPPTGEKPWEVAARYGPRPGTLSTNLVAAVLLDVFNRGLIQLDPGAKRITRADYEGMDVVEQLIVRAVTSRGREAAEYLRDVKEIVARRAEEAIEMSYRRLVGALIATGFIAFIAGVILYGAFLEAAPAVLLLYSLGPPLLAYLPPLLAPSYLLGRWRPGYRERAIAWHDFARRLARGDPRLVTLKGSLTPYVAALLPPRKARRILSMLGLGAAVVTAVYYLSRRSVLRSMVRSAAGGGGGGFGGGGAGAR